MVNQGTSDLDYQPQCKIHVFQLVIIATSRQLSTLLTTQLNMVSTSETLFIAFPLSSST